MLIAQFGILYTGNDKVEVQWEQIGNMVSIEVHQLVEKAEESLEMEQKEPVHHGPICVVCGEPIDGSYYRKMNDKVYCLYCYKRTIRHSKHGG